MQLYWKQTLKTDLLLLILWIIQKLSFSVEDLWTAGSETPVRLFKNTFFYRTSPVVASDSFRFPACSLLKKGLQQRRFYVNFPKFLRPSFNRNTSGWLLLVFTCNFENFFRAPMRNCLFDVQVAEFQQPNTIKIVSQVLFKHFLQKRDVTIGRSSFT